MKIVPLFIDDDFFVEAIVGYRAWYPILQNGVVTLMSISTRTYWQPGEDLRADCPWRKFHKHEPPGDGCDCGIWAYEDLDVLRRNHLAIAPFIYGEVLLWGDVAQHKTGYRAELARVSSIMRPSDGEGRHHQNLARLVAQRYDVPLIAQETSHA